MLVDLRNKNTSGESCWEVHLLGEEVREEESCNRVVQFFPRCCIWRQLEVMGWHKNTSGVGKLVCWEWKVRDEES